VSDDNDSVTTNIGVQRAGVVERRTGGTFEDVHRPLLQSASLAAMAFLGILFAFIALYVVTRSLAAWWDAGRVDLRGSHELVTLTLSVLGLIVTWVVLAKQFGVSHIITELISGRSDQETKEEAIAFTGHLALYGLLVLLWIEFGVRAALWLFQDILVVLTVIAAVAVNAGAWPGVYFFFTELTNSLVNSDSTVRKTIEELKYKKWETLHRESQQAEAMPDVLSMPQASPTLGLPPSQFSIDKQIHSVIYARNGNRRLVHEADTRNGRRELDGALLERFIIEVWSGYPVSRKAWVSKGLGRDDWEAMVNALDGWALYKGHPVKPMETVLQMLKAKGVIGESAPPYPEEDADNSDESHGTGHGTDG